MVHETELMNAYCSTGMPATGSSELAPILISVLLLVTACLGGLIPAAPALIAISIVLARGISRWYQAMMSMRRHASPYWRCMEERVAGPGAGPLGGKRILLIEEGVDSRCHLSRELRRLGAQIELVANGRDALERVFTAEEMHRGYDALLIGSHLPEQDATALVAVVRAKGLGMALILLVDPFRTDETCAAEQRLGPMSLGAPRAEVQSDRMGADWRTVRVSTVAETDALGREIARCLARVAEADVESEHADYLLLPASRPARRSA